MVVEARVCFADCSIVACGTLSMELNRLRENGFLNARKIFYTKPGRHEAPKELESQLIDRIASARKYSERILVVYGGKFCYFDLSNPERTIDKVLEEQGRGISRIGATHCVDMLADAKERELISKGAKTFWLTPGWVVHRHLVFQDWDRGQANETFPQCTGGAVLLDAVGFWDSYCERHPERVLDFSDWMGIPIHPHKVSLDRFERLLSSCALRAQEDV